MNGFVNFLLKILLGWTESAANWFISLFSNPSGHGVLAFFMENWKAIAILLVLAGVVIDLIVWMLRWRPYKVWASGIRRLLHKKELSGAAPVSGVAFAGASAGCGVSSETRVTKPVYGREGTETAQETTRLGGRYARQDNAAERNSYAEASPFPPVDYSAYMPPPEWKKPAPDANAAQADYGETRAYRAESGTRRYTPEKPQADGLLDDGYAPYPQSGVSAPYAQNDNGTLYPQGYARQGNGSYTEQGYAQQGYIPQSSDNYTPQGYNAQDAYAPQGNESPLYPQGYAPQSYNAPTPYAPQGYASADEYAQPNYSDDDAYKTRNYVSETDYHPADGSYDYVYQNGEQPADDGYDYGYQSGEQPADNGYGYRYPENRASDGAEAPLVSGPRRAMRRQAKRKGDGWGKRIIERLMMDEEEMPGLDTLPPPIDRESAFRAPVYPTERKDNGEER